MKLKSILYKKEQDDLVDKIINILEMDNENSIILYNLDNNKIKQKNTCYRCGREGHYATDCYASKHINGKYLS